MNEALTPATIATVKATVPAIAQFGTAITTAMYARLFQDEHIRALFNQSNQGESGAQVHALAAAILGYAQNIDNLGALAPVVERIAYKHVGYHILPEHYPFVANALLGAIREVLGEAATDEVLAAWGEAYWFLANILKAREAVCAMKSWQVKVVGRAGVALLSPTRFPRVASSRPSSCVQRMVAQCCGTSPANI